MVNGDDGKETDQMHFTTKKSDHYIDFPYRSFKPSPPEPLSLDLLVDSPSFFNHFRSFCKLNFFFCQFKNWQL